MTTKNAERVAPEFMSYRDAGDFLGVSRWTLSRAVDRGELTLHERGGVKRFRREELRSWILGEDAR